MKILIPILAIVVCVLLVACGGTTVVEQTTTEGNVDTTPEPQVQETPKDENIQTAAARPDMTSLRKDAIDCLEPGVRTCLPVNFARADEGDVVGFAFGVSNMFPDTKKIVLQVKFVRTQQKFGELALSEDKDYMAKWLTVNDLETYYELEPDEKLSQPILVKVGDLIAEETPTKPGAYVFEIEAKIFENGFYEDYVGKQEITVRVND